MNIPFFTPKAIGSTLIGLGSMGGGGGAVYLYQMPKTWKDLLIKEGYVFLSTDEDYKGMFHDQKDDSNWKTESDLSDVNENDVNTKAKNYCDGKFSSKLPSSSATDYSSTKQKLIAFCTTEGIKTVKGRLIQNKQKNWIDESNEEEKWKVVFAVYRYSDDFIAWLKEDNVENKSLDKTSKPSNHYNKLKTACTNLLKKNHKKIKDSKYFNYGSWWCVDPGYTTIKEKIKKEDNSWEERQTNDDWNDLKTRWENTEQVKTWANKAKNNSSDSGEGELDEDGLKALCKSDEENKGIQSKLSEDDSYQEKYLVIKAVCKKTSVSSE